MPRRVIGVINLAQSSSSSYAQAHHNARTIYTFFRDGVIVELPTRWVRSISFEPRYSPLTVNQYSHNLKDFLVWLCETERYGSLALDDALVAINRRDLQDWIQERKATRIQATTLRTREITVKIFVEWLTTEEAGRARTIEATPYKTGKLISPGATRRLPRYISSELAIKLLCGFHNESERCLAHTLYDTGLRISEAQRLRRCDLPNPTNFPAGVKYFPLYVRGSKGRGGQIKERIALISAPVLARISRYHNRPEYRFSPFRQMGDSDQPAFLSATGRLTSPRNVRAQMRLACRRAGLEQECISPHHLRHGAAFSILRSELGKDYLDKLFLVQQLFGHRSITTTEIYAVIPPGVLAKLNANQVITEKYEEAKRILDSTYLSPRKHSEHRGH